MGVSTEKGHASGRAKALAALLLAMGVCLLAPTSVFAAGSYVFEPTLSLTGNCATSKVDSVADPGLCPIPPGVPGKDHPSVRLEAPSITVDSYGDVYVASMMAEEGRIDVFSPQGLFITEISDQAGPQSMSVDGEGNLYVFDRINGKKQVRRFPPTAYEPLKGEIEYAEEPVVIANETTRNFFFLDPASSLAVNPTNGRLFLDTTLNIAVFGSAKEGNGLLEKNALEIPESGKALVASASIAIDAKHKKIYVSNKVGGRSIVAIFEVEAPHKELGKITGSTTPKGEFLSGEGFIQLDVDEETGHLFVGDIAAVNKVYEFEESGAYLATIEHSFEVAVGPGGVPGEIAVDNGSSSPHLQKEAWLFVPSVPSPSTGHVYAFEPKEQGPPIVASTSAGDVTDTEATLHATINPDGLETTYRLEYVSQQQFEASGFAEATLAGEGTLPKGGEGVAVAASAFELEPETEYRFRAFAENAEGEDEGEKTFATFASEEVLPPCEANEAFRTGLSALLPDCRAYELVTPPATNGRPPSGVGFTGVYFPTLEASPHGNRASFLIEGGVIPGNEGAGAFNGDLYLATRTSEGWTSEVTGPSGKEAVGPNPGSVSPDQTYSFWEDIHGSLVYLRYPDGHSDLVGQGSLGSQPTVIADLITEGGDHVIFGATAHLEPNAPPKGTTAVYDRSAAGPTQVVSLLPGEVTPGEKEDATYLGASENGEGVAFRIGETIYLRLHGAQTFEVAGPGSIFAGVSAGGARIFYVEGGDLFAFDAETEETIPFSSSGDVTPVNVASGGTRAYFISPSVLTGGPNPHGEKAKAGAENLYLSEEGAITFVGRVTNRDVEGELTSAGQLGGLGLWTNALPNNPSIDSSRTTPSGTTFLFESRANLDGFDSEGFAQVYRYNSVQNRLDCLSCGPTGNPPTGDASLQSVAQSQPSLIPFSSHAKIPNQSPDGKRAFFQTAEPLVLGDTDELLDVYEWEEQGVGSCGKPGGCIYLISGPHSSSPDFLFAMSQSGDDVFFRTADLLLPRDKETTLSLYDARLGGGFPEPETEPECEGEGCRPPNPAPSLQEDTTSVVGLGGDVEEPKRHCPKGKHAVKRHGKEVCVKNHHKKKHRRGTGSKKKGGSR